MNAIGTTASNLWRAAHRKYFALRLQEMIETELRPLLKPRLRLTWSDEVTAPHDVILRRRGAGYDILVSPWFDHWVAFYLIQDKIGTCLWWLHHAGPEVTQISFSASDGDRFSQARFSYSSCEAAVIPLPDSHFFRDRGYRAIDRDAAELGRPWAERDGTILWRGMPSGNGYFTNRKPHRGHPGQVQRLRLAAIAAEHGIDFGFVVPPDLPEYPEMAARGMLRPRVQAHEWAGRKYALDIDGFTNAWSNLLTRLKLGCCLLKVESDYGFRQWYSHHLRPFEHFVPIAADFSDLGERIDWVQSHDREAAQIAAAGQNLARAMTFESETAVAARLIGDHWTS